MTTTLEQAIQHIKQKEWHNALTLLSKLEESGNITPAIIGNIAACWNALGEKQKAIAALFRGATYNPDNHKILYNLGNELIKCGNPHGGINVLQQCISKDAKHTVSDSAGLLSIEALLSINNNLNSENILLNHQWQSRNFHCIAFERILNKYFDQRMIKDVVKLCWNIAGNYKQHPWSELSITIFILSIISGQDGIITTDQAATLVKIVISLQLSEDQQSKLFNLIHAPYHSQHSTNNFGALIIFFINSVDPHDEGYATNIINKMLLSGSFQSINTKGYDNIYRSLINRPSSLEPLSEILILSSNLDASYRLLCEYEKYIVTSEKASIHRKSFVLSTKKLCLEYLLNTIESSEKIRLHNSDSALINQTDKISEPRDIQYAKAYSQLIQKLTDETIDDQNNEPQIELPEDFDEMLIVGDSHVFSHAHLTTTNKNRLSKQSIKVGWIPGLKAFHLSTSHTNLRFKAGLNCYAKDYSSQTTFILICCGEIDTRLNEGMYHYSKKNDIPLKDVIQQTARNYIDFISRLKNSYKCTFCILPVIPVAKSTYNDDDQAKLKASIVHQFNSCLKQECTQTELLFLEQYYVNLLTESNYLHENAHCDGVHLTRKAAAYSLKMGLQMLNF